MEWVFRLIGDTGGRSIRLVEPAAVLVTGSILCIILALLAFFGSRRESEYEAAETRSRAWKLILIGLLGLVASCAFNTWLLTGFDFDKPADRELAMALLVLELRHLGAGLGLIMGLMLLLPSKRNWGPRSLQIKMGLWWLLVAGVAVSWPLLAEWVQPWIP